MADLTFYNAKHSLDLDFAIKRANSIIEDVIDRDPNRTTEMNAELDIGDTPKAKAERLHDMIQQVMFSSGYFCLMTMTHKHDGVYSLQTIITKMTPEQKAQCLKIPTRHAEPDDSGDPQAMD